ncbi:MAG: PAS domain-containing protein, partial [Actinobacteria bacterium]|nr:PAS domain-containing protein [Actinomycetota bacterium]
MAAARLHLAVVRTVAIIALPASVPIGWVGIATNEPSLVLTGSGCLFIGVVAAWQLLMGRPQAVLLVAISAFVLGVSSVFVAHELAVTLSSSIVVLIMVGISLLPGRRVAAYLAVMVIPWMIHPLVKHTFWGGRSWHALVLYLIQAGVLLFGISSILSLRNEIDRGEDRYTHLFRRAPVALWEHDFTAIQEWLARLRSSGVEDLRAYLAAHPDQVLHGIGLVRTANVNDAAVRLLGAADAGDLLGSIPPALTDSETRRIFAEQFIAIWDAAPALDLEYRGRRFDGTSFDGMLWWSNPAAEHDHLHRVISSVSDLTGLRSTQRELEAAVSSNRALLEAVPDLLFLCDSDGTYRDYHVSAAATGAVHGATESDLYVPPSEFLGKRPHQVLPYHLAEKMMIAVVTALETDCVQSFEYELPIAGEDRYWEMRISPLKGRAQILALVRDITTATRARIELERLVQSKDDFIAAISHEIRTPLTGIVGFANLLNDADRDLDPRERRQMLETLAAQSADLTHIVEDLLVAAKADLGRLELAAVPTSLRAQAAQVLEGWDRDSVHDLTVVGESDTCIGDPARVRQIVRNLISNALRYGGPNVEIRIDQGPSFGTLTVIDDGPGIPPDHIEQAFRPYHRAAPRDGLTAALGIGLPIARTLARLMNGDLTYEHTGEAAR